MPVEHLPRSGGISHQHGRISNTARRIFGWDAPPAELPDACHNFTDGVALTCPEIQLGALAAASQIFQGAHVRVGEVHDMDIVTDRSTVRRGIVRAVNLDFWSLAQR